MGRVKEYSATDILTQLPALQELLEGLGEERRALKQRVLGEIQMLVNGVAKGARKA